MLLLIISLLVSVQCNYEPVQPTYIPFAVHYSQVVHKIGTQDPFSTYWYVSMVSLMALRYMYITMQVDDSSTAVSGSCIVSALLQPLHLYQHSVLGEVADGADRGMLHVGGPHRVWIKRTQQHYYTLTQAAGNITGDNDGEWCMQG